MGEYPGVNDDWMDVISSQSTSLLSVDFSGSDITDYGLVSLKGCKNLESLNFNFCDQISNRGLEHLSGKLCHFWSFLFFLLIDVFLVLCMWMFPNRSYYITIIPDAFTFIFLMDFIPLE